MDSTQTILTTLQAFAVSVKASETPHSVAPEFGYNGIADRVLSVAHPVIVSRILEHFIHELILIFHPGADADEAEQLYAVYAKAYDIFYAEID